ncbi:hypothetical protein RHIZ_14915 [Rhizobium skierniewicense]|nr:hypothetical protein [Rhizobium skierniewicense]
MTRFWRLFCWLPQSAVLRLPLWRAIAALEKDLGVQLIVRTVRQLSPTIDSAFFAAHIQPTIEALERAPEDIRNAYKTMSQLF